MERRTFVGGLPVAAGMVGVISLSAEPSSLDNEKHKAARWRLQNARAFFPKGEFVRAGDLLYQLGIASQLALTACVVADGWTDEDCRRRIGLGTEGRRVGEGCVSTCRSRGSPDH